VSFKWPLQPPPQIPDDPGDWRTFRQRWHAYQSALHGFLQRWFKRNRDANGELDHGTLTGLADDDHPQYLLKSVLTTKGDMLARSATVPARLAVGTDGFPLISDAASALGVKWATTRNDLTWWVTFDRRPVVGAAAASPPTLAVADVSLNDTTGPSASGGRDATDTNVTWFLTQFFLPEELDLTQAVSAKVYVRLASNPAAGNQLQFTTRLRMSNRDEAIVSAGTLREVSGTLVITGYSAGDLAIIPIASVIQAGDASADDFVHGVVERDATAGNANDTYAATTRVLGIRFVGKRKVWT
jgi:hypothetical protein